MYETIILCNFLKVLNYLNSCSYKINIDLLSNDNRHLFMVILYSVYYLIEK